MECSDSVNLVLSVIAISVALTNAMWLVMMLFITRRI